MEVNKYAQIYSGYTFRQEKITTDTGDVALLSAKDIDPLSLEISKQEYISLDTIKRPEYLRSGDVLMCNRGLIKAGVYRGDGKAVAGQTLTVIRLHESSQYIPEYIAVLCNSSWGKNLFNTHAIGATIKQLPIKLLRELEIPNISIEKQQALVNLWQTWVKYQQITKHKLSLQQSIINQSITNTVCHKK